jgi:hypothetical protein
MMLAMIATRRTPAKVIQLTWAKGIRQRTSMVNPH